MALSIDDLRSFILVASERSVTRAAMRVGVSQQSVSERIRRLERRIGVRLFSRTSYGMQPTTAGFRLLPYASQCVSLVEQALAVVGDDDLVRVRMQRSVSAAIQPLLDGFVGSAHIDASAVDDLDGALAAISGGGVDVVLGVLSGNAASASEEADVPAEHDEADEPADGSAPAEAPDPAATVVVEQLFADPVVWVAPPEHPLAGRSGPLSLAELGGFPVGLAAANGGADSEVDGADRDGLRVVARSTVASELAAGQLVELPVDPTGWVVPISIAYRQSDHDRPAIVALRDALVEGHARTLSRGSQGGRS